MWSSAYLFQALQAPGLPLSNSATVVGKEAWTVSHSMGTVFQPSSELYFKNGCQKNVAHRQASRATPPHPQQALSGNNSVKVVSTQVNNEVNWPGPGKQLGRGYMANSDQNGTETPSGLNSKMNVAGPNLP